jgi:hypothetical protein
MGRVALATPFDYPGCVPLSKPTKCRKLGVLAVQLTNGALLDALNGTCIVHVLSVSHKMQAWADSEPHRPLRTAAHRLQQEEVHS